jgi:hypothetical protein
MEDGEAFLSQPAGVESVDKPLTPACFVDAEKPLEDERSRYHQADPGLGQRNGEIPIASVAIVFSLLMALHTVTHALKR